MKRILFLVLAGALVSGCDTTSSVDFKKGRSTISDGDSGTAVNGLAWTHGGVALGTASGGSTVSFTLGDAVDQVQTVTTPGGYQVQLNIQGQLVY